MAVKKTLKKPLKVKKASKQKEAVVESIKAISHKQTKSEIILAISTDTNLPRKAVLTVFESLRKLIVGNMKKKGSGEFTIPQVAIRVKRKIRPASKKRMGRNPATGEQIMIAAKPARTVVKIIPLRALKESVSL